MNIRIDKRILFILDTSASKQNQGYKAGLNSESFDLGTPYYPIVVTQNNALDLLLDLDGVLDEYHGLCDDITKIIMPEWFYNILKDNPVLGGYGWARTHELIVAENIFPIREAVYAVHAMRKSAITINLYGQEEIDGSYIATMYCENGYKV
jgi:hypothetical protein